MLVDGSTPTPPIIAPESTFVISEFTLNAGESQMAAANEWTVSQIFFAFSKSGTTMFA